MTKKTKIEVRQRECRTAINALTDLENLSDEQSAELDTLTGEFRQLDAKLNALDTAGEGEPEKPEKRAKVESTDTRAALEQRCSVGRYFEAIADQRQVDGAELELQQEEKLAANFVPLSLVAGGPGGLVEKRAATTAPSDAGQNAAEPLQGVFPDSVGAFLGIDMPTVPSGDRVHPILATNAIARTPAKTVTATETNGSFTASVLTPKRLQASFSYGVEDLARFPAMDAALRANLSMSLTDGLDRELLVGDTTGLLTGTVLADNDVSALATFSDYLSELALSRVDGKWASTTADIRSVVGSATYAHAGVAYLGSMESVSALDRVGQMTAGVRVSAHVPGVASKKQEAIVRRGNRLDATLPVWSGLKLVFDEITGVGEGAVKLTATLLYAFKLLRADGFHKQQFQVKA